MKSAGSSAIKASSWTGRYLGHGVDGQIFGLVLLSRVDIDQVRFVIGVQLLEQCMGDGVAAAQLVIEMNMWFVHEKDSSRLSALPLRLPLAPANLPASCCQRVVSSV